MDVPLSVTRYGGSGLGAGPDMLIPFMSNWLPWQLQPKCGSGVGWYWTTQPRCVQRAESALNCPVGVWMRSTGSRLKRTIFTDPSAKSPDCPTRTDSRAEALSSTGVTYWRTMPRTGRAHSAPHAPSASFSMSRRPFSGPASLAITVLSYDVNV